MYRKKIASIIGVVTLVCGLNVANPAFASSAGCTAAAGGIAFTYVGSFAQIVIAQPFNAGETFTVTFTTYANGSGVGTKSVNVGQGNGSGNANVGGFGNFSLSGPGAFGPFTVPVGGITQLSMSIAGGQGVMNSTGTITCTSASSTTPAAAASTISQTINNAQVALINGAQTLQSYNDWVSKAVMGSFGLTRNGSAAVARQSTPTAQAKLERLRAEERELSEELAEHKDGGDAVAIRLQATRTDLMYARLTVALEARSAVSALRTLPSSESEPERTSLTDSRPAGANMSGPDESNIAEGPIGSASRPQQASPGISLGARDLNGFCGDDCDVLGAKWNVWVEGRAIGALDSVAQTNALGFVGSTGVDYKLQPWLAVGLSLGVETFETKFGTLGMRSGTLGFTAMPYVGVRLSDNLFASAFVGVSTIAYNTNPLTNVSASFNATRVMFGGALTGVWRDGPWRFQPTLYGTYGSESQNGYTDSAGTAVSGQTLTYGRIGAGPEVGYTFRPQDASWSVEPFVLAKANLDLASSNSSVLNGQSVVLRPGTLGSGSSGLGMNANLDNGVYLRVQGTYDSIGVWGLDVWSGQLRAGMTF